MGVGIIELHSRWKWIVLIELRWVAIATHAIYLLAHMAHKYSEL